MHNTTIVPTRIVQPHTYRTGKMRGVHHGHIALHTRVVCLLLLEHYVIFHIRNPFNTIYYRNVNIYQHAGNDMLTCALEPVYILYYYIPMQDVGSYILDGNRCYRILRVVVLNDKNDHSRVRYNTHRYPIIVHIIAAHSMGIWDQFRSTLAENI